MSQVRNLRWSFPLTVTCQEDQGIHITLDDFVPRDLVKAFLHSLVETEGYDHDSGEWPEYEKLLKALE